MGIGDSIRNAAENAMKDLGGTAEPHDDAHVPEPGAPDDEIKVHSTISEASNTMEAAEDERRSDEPAGSDGQDRPAQRSESGAGTSGDAPPAGGGTSGESGTAAGTGQPGTGQSGEGTVTPPGHVPGPGGLPAPEPDELRADPTEADKDPSTGTGRGGPGAGRG